jgi:hypothetical protein
MHLKQFEAMHIEDVVPGVLSMAAPVVGVAAAVVGEGLDGIGRV